MKANDLRDYPGGRDLVPYSQLIQAPDRMNSSAETISVTSNSSLTCYYTAPQPDTYFDGGDFTVSAWVRVRTCTAWSRLFDIGNGPFGDNVYVTLFQQQASSGRCAPELAIYNGSSNVFFQGSVQASIPLGEWTHLAVTLSNSTFAIYLNAAQVASAATSSGAMPRGCLRTGNYFGKSSWPNDPYANVSLDEIRFYNQALDAAAVRLDMNTVTLNKSVLNVQSSKVNL